MKKIKRFREMVSLILVSCLMTAFIPQTMAQTPTEKTVQASAYKHLQNFMKQYDKSKFSSVIKIGNIETYRTELSDVIIKVDTKMKANAMYDPSSNTLYLSKDPAKVKASESLSLGETVWHELTHKIENTNGDIGILDSKNYAERNVEYMTYVVGVALPILQKMENDKNATPQKIQQYWNLFIKKMAESNKLPELMEYPPDFKLMEQWFGFKVDQETIKSFYLSGKGGAKIKSAIASIPKPVPAANFNGSWETNFGVIVMTQTGTTVTGTYSYDSGSLTGIVTGNTLKGTWVESDDKGTFVFTLSADGKSFTGSWQETEPDPNQGGGWNGKKQ